MHIPPSRMRRHSWESTKSVSSGHIVVFVSLKVCGSHSDPNCYHFESLYMSALFHFVHVVVIQKFHVFNLILSVWRSVINRNL